jgi:hypothetical protein
VELQEALTIIELQRGHITALELQVSERDDSLREANVEIALLRFEAARLRRALYGDKSERFVDDGASSTASSTPGAQGANDSADTTADAGPRGGHGGGRGPRGGHRRGGRHPRGQQQRRGRRAGVASSPREGP